MREDGRLHHSVKTLDTKQLFETKKLLRQPVSSYNPSRRRLGLARFLSLILVIIGCLLVGTPTPVGGQNTSREYQIKAAFLYNFVKFIEWPTDTFISRNSHFIFCVIGRDPFGLVLESTLKEKTLKGRMIVIRRFEGIEGTEHCHILFISSSERAHLEQIVAVSQDLSLLTVGDMDQFAQSGGIINFILKKAKIRFEINVAAARRSRLKISSKLLKLATIVRK